jgi:hypothetical protein
MLSKEVLNNDGSAVTLPVNSDLSVTVIRNNAFGYLMTMHDVSSGYGVAVNTIRNHYLNHKDELVEGTHYVRGSQILGTLGNNQPNQIYWTKAGVIRLGFFIKSERAKMFRDWAEKVILTVTAPKVELPAAQRRNHNRLSKDRLVEILALVAQVDDGDIRRALVTKLVPDLNIPPVQLSLPFSTDQNHSGV